MTITLPPLVIDTETTGFFDFKKPADHPEQPRLAHLAMARLNPALELEDMSDFYVKRHGWVMGEQAGRVNGLTNEFLDEHGVDVEIVLHAYTEAIQEGRAVYAFNAQYDTKIMRGELRRAKMDDMFEQTPNVCLMRSSMGVVQKPNGGRGWPKLEHCCAHFGIVNDAEHKAHGDTLAAVELLRHLHQLVELGEPRVHYAKNRPT